MKKSVLIFMVLFICLFSILAVNSQKTSLKSVVKTKELHKELIEMIKKADQLKYKLEFKLNENQIIGYYQGVGLAGVTGKYQNKVNVMAVMKEFFSEKAALIEIEKIGLYVIDQKVGFIMATGEESFSINENTKFEFVNEELDKKLVRISMRGESGSKSTFYYTLKKVKEKWIIVDEAEQDNVFKIENNWITITTSSILTGENILYRTYSGDKVWDKKPQTAWVEGEKGHGLGEWIEFSFFKEQIINGIKIINGYAKNQKTYYNNNRLKKIKISFNDGTLINAELADNQLKPQIIKLAKSKIINRIRFLIVEIYPGAKDDDTCISEIDFVK